MLQFSFSSCSRLVVRSLVELGCHSKFVRTTVYFNLGRSGGRVWGTFTAFLILGVPVPPGDGVLYSICSAVDFTRLVRCVIAAV
jgi:hypothetical protein